MFPVFLIAEHHFAIYNIIMTFEERIKNIKFALGTSEFTKIIDSECHYIDKTLLIKEILDSKSEAILFTRPRRFGKTLNMTMLRTFFEKPLDGRDTSHYFKNLKIWQCGEKYISEQGKRPVIYLTLKDIKPTKFEQAITGISLEVADEIERYQEIFESRKLTDFQKNRAKELVQNLGNIAFLAKSLKTLSMLLHKHYGEQPIILIDEYDVPIQSGFEHGYYDEIIAFMRNFLSGAFKDNPSLYRGILTGVSRVSKESIFSGLNNLDVDTIFNKPFSTFFGFTQEEINKMFKFYGIEDKLKEAESWYDGYIFGTNHIYNPWSIISYLKNGCIPGNYWVNMSENGLAGEAMCQLRAEDRKSLEELMSGKKTRAFAATHIIYNELGKDIAQAYGLLAQTGYLRASDVDLKPFNYLCTMEIPNRELFSAYAEEVVDRILKPREKRIATEIIKAVLDGRPEDLQKCLSDFLLETCSFLDLTEEKDYQNILIGLLASMKDGYDITANCEAGHGRADISMCPRIDNKHRNVLPGIIIELKHYEATESEKDNPENLESELERQAEDALKQIETKSYISRLKSAGCVSILKYGVAASGKYVKIIRKSE